MGRIASDRASQTRKRALRRLARQEYDAYRAHYTAYTDQGYDRHQARSRAWTALRGQFPDDYLSFYALEQVAPDYDVSPGIRTKSWARAMALLGDLRKHWYVQHLAAFRAQGLSKPSAAYRASNALREKEPELFAQLLADEIRMWQRLERPSAAASARVTVDKAALDKLIAYASASRNGIEQFRPLLDALDVQAARD